MFNQFNSGRRQSSNIRDLLRRGQAAAKAGDHDEAEFYLEWVLRSEPTADQIIDAWYSLSTVARDPQRRRSCLEEVLARNPAHALARRDLALLDGRLTAEEIVDPEVPPPEAPRDPRPAQADRFVCPQCAARMVFTPDGRQLHCEHCGYHEGRDPAGLAASEQDFIVALASGKARVQPVAMQVFQCAGCAAELLLAPETISTTCPYCDATYAMRADKTREMIPPQGILPLATGRGTAQKRVDGWLDQHRIHAPAPVHGFYLPAWTFDVGGHLVWRGRRYRTGQQGFNQSRLEEIPVSGQHAVHVDDLLLPATNKFPRKLLQAVLDYDLRAVQAYDARLLAGWPATLYDLPLVQAALQARKIAYHQERRRGHVPAGVREISFSSAEMAILSYKLVLLPLWIAHVRVQQRILTVLINGQTGRLSASRSPQTGLFNRLRRFIR
jgi:DNA-directed RNA polymerase subunit RPC12/RpoP